MPLFPLNVVLFPGMVLPLHIFEPRYHEMIDRCIEEKIPFGVVLIQEGQEVGGPGTPIVSARRRALRGEPQIRRPDEYDHRRHTAFSHFGTRPQSQLSQRQSCAIPGRQWEHTRRHEDGAPGAAQDCRVCGSIEQGEPDGPKVGPSTGRPDDTGFLGRYSAPNQQPEKQELLAMPGIPEMLDRERYLLSCEALLLRHMVDTQADLDEMSGGPSGYIFSN